MTAPIVLEVNGVRREVQVPADTPLLWVLREPLALVGTRFGCGMALCGACTVHVNGEAVRACALSVESVAGKSITTIEGLTGAVGDALRGAWLALDVAQCGYCQSGQLMSAAALLTTVPNPTDADIDRAMDGNICRCGTYPRLRAAIREAGKRVAAAKASEGVTATAPTRED